MLGTQCSPVSGGVGGGEAGVLESAYTCYSMIYGVSVPPYTPVPVTYSVSAFHTMHAHTRTRTHTHTHTTTTAPPPRDKERIISSFVMVPLD